MPEFSDNSSYNLDDKVTINQYDDYGSLIDKISQNKEESSIKNETLQLLWDAKWIIELNANKSKEKWKKVAREYEDLRMMTILALKENNDITKNELSNLKNQVEKKHQDMAKFYLDNPDMLNLETNKDIVIKTLKLMVLKKQENQSDPLLATVDFSNINKSLLNDINVIKATRPEWLSVFSIDILSIDDKNLKDEKFVENLLSLCDKKAKATLIMKTSLVMDADKLIALIWKINSWSVEALKIENKDIPIDILKKDEKNVMWLNEEWKKLHLNKTEEITKDSIDKLLSSKLDAEDLAYEIEYFLNSEFDITDISDENITKILVALNDSNCLENAPKLLLQLNKKINVVNNFLQNEDSLLIRYLTTELRKNQEIQKTYINILAQTASSEKSKNSLDYMLTLIDIDDIEIAKYFYDTINSLWENTANKVFSNFHIRENIRRITDNAEFKKDENNTKMLEHLSSFDWWWENLLNAATKNKETLKKIEKDEKEKINMINDLKGILVEKVSNEEINSLISRISNLEYNKLWESESLSICNELLKLCWNNEKKVEEFIKKVKDYEIKKSVEKTDGIIKELNDKKFDKFAVKLEDIQNNFEDFLWTKIAEFKEKNKDKPLNIDAISKQAIEEYLKTNKKEWITPEEEAKIREILNTFVARRRLKSERDNIEEYRKTMSWEMKKEDFDKVMQKSLEQKYDFKDEKAIVEKVSKIEQNLFIPNEDNYVKNGNTYTLEWANWEKIEWITEQEKNMTLGNPEATQNLINFHDFFKKLNLEWVWKYRWELMNAIWDIYIDPNDADSIKTEELRKFWNKILTFIANAWKDTKDWEKETINLSSIQSVNMELQKFSMSASPLNDKATFNRYWEDRFTAFLRQQWIIWWAYFKLNWFKNYL